MIASKRSTLGIALGAAVLALGLAGSAHAGHKETKQVTVGATFAYGSLGSARNSADGNQYIGCYLNTANVACYARNSAGTLKTCITTNAAMIANARAIGSDSYIYLTWNSSGQCTTLSVSNMSTYEPKQP